MLCSIKLCISHTSFVPQNIWWEVRTGQSICNKTLLYLCRKRAKKKKKINQTQLKASIPTDWASYLELFSFSFPLALSKIIHFSFRNRTKSIFFYFSYLSKKYFLFFMNHDYNFFMVPSYNSQVVQFNDYCQLPFILNLEFYHF